MRLFERRNEVEKELPRERRDRASHRQPALVSIIDLMTEKDRKLFIKKIFQNDPSQFDGFIAKLNSLTNWREAFTVIEEEFGKRHIHEHQNDAFRFTDLVFKRFFPE